MSTRYTAGTNLQIGKTLISKHDEFDPQAAGLKGRALERQIELGNVLVREEKSPSKGRGNNGRQGGDGGQGGAGGQSAQGGAGSQAGAGAQGSGQAGAGGGQPAA